MKISDEPWRVLIVDDHPLIRDGLRGNLQRGFPKARIEDVGNAEDAQQKACTLQPQLILMDVNLPGMNGLDLARRFRITHPEARVLMIAGDTDPWTVREALALGASGFLSKTRTAEVLGEAVLTVLRGGQFLCEDSRGVEALDDSFPNLAIPEPEPGPAVLSDRERQILRHLAHGENTKGIAGSLDISPKTVETHRIHLMRKLGIDNIAALTRYAIRHGLTSP
jgi:DNA-binding NarL/FixJ family response regulator